MTEFSYVGTELKLFACVHNWKSYWSSQLLPFVAGDVVEVGAGIGSNTPYLQQRSNRRWICLEPDPLLAAQLKSNIQQSGSYTCEVVCGTLQSLGDTQFDTIIYIDVLEHIDNDREELSTAATRLRRGGRLIVLAPAHQQLFTPFDAAVGHFRRYNRESLRTVSPSGLRIERMWYLDSAGLALSLANRCFLKQSMPTEAQLRFWNQRVIPISRVLDRCVFGRAGKSIVGVWRR
jgi:SAM-dependent methyltransferase